MKNKSSWIGYLLINASSIFIASAGILAKYISMFPPFMIFARSIIAVILLFTYFTIKRQKPLTFPIKDKALLLTGVLFTIHWITFFYSIKYGGVSLAAIVIFTHPIFTTLLEPFVAKTQFHLRHLFISSLLIIGISILTPDASSSADEVKGVLFGLCSAFTYALRNILSRGLIDKYPSHRMMYYQLIIVVLLTLPFSTAHSFDEISENILPLIGLGIFPTIIGHSLVIESYSYFTATRASILSSLQPVFAIILAILLFNESPTAGFWMGSAIIFASVIFEVYAKSKIQPISSKRGIK